MVIEKPTAAMCADCHVSRERDELILKMFGLREAADKRLASLTNRQHDIMHRVLSGHPSKNIAADLHISQRTVENHRSEIMKRTGARSLPELARLALAADWTIPTV
jgi:two-component system CheB/CheR fusion protein